MRNHLLCFLPMLLAAAAAHAGDGVTASDAYARATAPGARTGAVYLTLTAADRPDRLLSVTTPVADRAELHEIMQMEGMSHMHPVDALAVAPGKPITLAPGGTHIMLMGLHQGLAEGSAFPLVLHFEQTGDVSLSVAVRAAGAMPAPAHDHHP